MDIKERKACGLFRGVGVPTCRPRGVQLEVEPARIRVHAHAPQDHRPLAPGAVPVPHASRASPGRIASRLKDSCSDGPRATRSWLTPRRAVPDSVASRVRVLGPVDAASRSYRGTRWDQSGRASAASPPVVSVRRPRSQSSEEHVGINPAAQALLVPRYFMSPCCRTCSVCVAPPWTPCFCRDVRAS
jgi:hypothetical protein